MITTNSRGKNIRGHTPNAWTPDQLKAIFTDGTVKVAAQAYQDPQHGFLLPKIHFEALTKFDPNTGCSQCSEDGDGQGSTTGTDDTLVPPEQANGNVSPTTSISGSTTGTDGQDSTTGTDGSTLEHANGDVSPTTSISGPTTGTDGQDSTTGTGGSTLEHANGGGVSSGACCIVS